MYKNYFFLKRCLAEVQDDLAGLDVTSVFSQEKDKIIFRFSSGKSGDGYKFLEISCSPGNSYFTLKKNYSRAKKNTVDFFTGYIPSKLISADIAGYDRIIRLNFERAPVYFTVRGKFTNVMLIADRDNIIPFKKTDPEFLISFFDEMDKTIFISPFQENYFDFHLIGSENFIDELKKKYPVFGNDIILEIKARKKDGTREEFISELRNILTEIKTGKPAVFINNDSNEIKLAVHKFKLFSGWEENKFENIIDALNFYLNRKIFLEAAVKNENLIRRNIGKELERVGSKINSLRARLERGSMEDEYKKSGNLLLININSVKKGMREIELEDLYNENKKIKIKLNRELSPRGNVDHYFELAKKERTGLEKSRQLLNELKLRRGKLEKEEKELELLETAKENPDIYKDLKKELKIKESAPSGPARKDLREKFKHYIIGKKYNVYVGRDSANNDLLTLQFAKQNDYWFHARGVSGSHLVLKVQNPAEKIPKNILKAAAAIAAFHSKSKTSGLAPVSFTLKKYVVKKKGMEPGKVALLREEVLIVKPEIPGNAEFISKQSE